MCTLECKSYYHLGLDHITSSSWMSRQFTSNTPLHGAAVITARTVSTSEVTESVTRALLARCTFADICFAAVRRPFRGMKGRVDTRHYEGIWHQTLSHRGPIKKVSAVFTTFSCAWCGSSGVSHSRQTNCRPVYCGPETSIRKQTDHSKTRFQGPLI